MGPQLIYYLLLPAFMIHLSWFPFSNNNIRSEESDGEVVGDSKPNIEELEMLLEAYFAQIDGILQKLSDVSMRSFQFSFLYIIDTAYFALCFIKGLLLILWSKMNDYVDDTEDCINIMLDDKQNQLLQMGVMLSTANMIINAGIVVVGIFGMNITISLFSAPEIKFWETAIGTIGGCIALYILSVSWGRKRNLLAL